MNPQSRCFLSKLSPVERLKFLRDAKIYNNETGFTYSEFQKYLPQGFDSFNTILGWEQTKKLCFDANVSNELGSLELWPGT
jgi:hypothetical protein